MAGRTEKLILNKRSVHVTPFGVDLKEFSKNDFSKGNENTIVIGTVKRLTKKYGIDTLIKAFHQVKNRLIGQTNLDLKLVIVGNGSEKESLIRLSYDLGLGNDVEFVGHVPNKLVKTYLNKMDIFVALSRLESESFGVAIVEASAMRVPVVCSNIGGIPEVVVDGETGFLVEVDNVNVAADRILELVLDKELRMQMGNSGRKFIESTYGFEDNADIILNIYSEMLNGIQ
jgi:glycosyltransferase involved in cell wall biosynthesis